MSSTRDTGLVGGDAVAGVAIAITPSGDDLAWPTRALWVGGAGDLSVIMETSGNTVVFPSVLAGTWMPIRVTRVNAATTATNIVAVR
jgi:hypothetical protein